MGNVNDKQHFAAWIDLLGFKSYLEKDNLEPAVALLRDKLPGVLRRAVPEKIHTSKGIEAGDARCEIEQFQDTMVLWTRESNSEDLETLLEVVREVLLLMHSNGIPCRGGIAKGTLYTSRLDPFAPRMVNATLGQAVLRAHEVERGAKWAGITIHESIHADKTLCLDVLEPRKPSGNICRYMVPGLKGHEGSEGKHWVVGWYVPHDIDFARSFLRLWPTPPEETGAREKHDNTKAFMDWWVTTFKSDLVKIRDQFGGKGPVPTGRVR